MSSWTDVFLIPFKVVLERTKNIKPFIPFSKVENEGASIDSVENIMKESIHLRKSLLLSVETAVETFGISQLYCMIFGEKSYIDLSNKEEIIFYITTLEKFKYEDQICVDTLDKIIIDELISRLEHKLSEFKS